MPDNGKINIAAYWAAGCGGCDVSILDTHEKLLDIVSVANVVFWPIAVDFKYKDVEAFEDGFIDVTLFNGAIRNSENLHLAKLLRKKSKVLVAYGACSHMGGIPGLANLTGKEEIFDYVYSKSPSTDNPEHIRPETKVKVKEGELEIPRFYNTVRTLDQVVDVDYYLPGCPPNPERFLDVWNVVLSGKLPPKGSVVGAFPHALCEDCPREVRNDKKFTEVRRIHLVDHKTLDKEQCFLEQGIMCCGPATRSGCGERCIRTNMPCRGCYGPMDDVLDQGAKLISSIASVLDLKDEEEIQRVIDQIEDPVGTFYRFGLPVSLLRRKSGS